jgi:16S rRNA (cytosine967-C5)-methyltransferase
MSTQKSPLSRPRERAVRIITEVLTKGRPLDLVLEEAFASDAAHCAWLQDVCSGVLRWKGRLDLAIDSGALRKKPTGGLRKALWVAAYQLIAQDDVPAHVVVNEAVESIRRKEGQGPAGFANAVLRRIAEKARQWRELPFPADAPLEEKAAWASLPVWMWERLVCSRGEDWAVQYAQASLDRPTLWVRSRDSWAEQARSKLKLSEGALPGMYRLGEASKPVREWPGFSEGRFFVQDVSSQVLVDLFSSELKKASSRRVLDLCAAPGGKSIGLAWNGFEVFASDIDSNRLKSVQENIQRLGKNLSIQILEKSQLQSQLFDGIWVDAPCTGSGILRRHPDVRWLKQEEQLAALNRIQRELLLEAWDRLKHGGLLAYSVCSVLSEEGRDLIRSAGLPGMNVLLEKELGPFEDPYGDGFYLALLRKA